MKEDIFKLVPTYFLCPYCGKWHRWKDFGDLSKPIDGGFKLEFHCQEARARRMDICFVSGFVYYKTSIDCLRATFILDGKKSIEEIDFDTEESKITFKVPFESKSELSRKNCKLCGCKEECNLLNLAEEGDGRNMTITFGFKYDSDEYFDIIKKEEHKMKEMPRFMTTLAQWIEEAKKWGEEHKTTIRWGVAVGAVVIATKLLKDKKVTADEGKKLGLPFLDNNVAIKELTTLGTIYALGYGVSTALFKPKSSSEASKDTVAEVEEKAKKYPSLAQRAEQVLPTAISILITYAITQKPECLNNILENSNDLVMTAKTYVGVGVDVILDKLKIDRETAKKIVVCVGVAALLTFLYKGAKEKEKLSEMATKFAEFSVETAKALAPPVFAAVATVLVNEKLWPEDVIDVAFEELDGEVDAAIHDEEFDDDPDDTDE